MSQAQAWELLRWRSRVQVHRQELAPDVVLSLARIPAGSFLRGARDRGEVNPARGRLIQQVQLEEFLLGQTPITQAQWRAVAQWQPLDGEQWGRELDPDPSHFKGDNRPVERVSWHEAMEFCNRLCQRTAKAYTLPSEAQWEYACRAGTSTPYHFGETISPELATYNAKQTTDVGIFPANAWGLHDMHGNVWEWCLDEWHSSYEGAPTDGNAWVNAGESENKNSKLKRRLLRGGSWSSDPRDCRSACRNDSPPDGRGNVCGFRVCCLPQDSAS